MTVILHVTLATLKMEWLKDQELNLYHKKKHYLKKIKRFSITEFKTDIDKGLMKLT